MIEPLLGNHQILLQIVFYSCQKRTTRHAYPKPCLRSVIRTSCVFESSRETIALPLGIALPSSYVLLLSYKQMKPFVKSLFLEQQRSTSCRSSSDLHATVHWGFLKIKKGCVRCTIMVLLYYNVALIKLPQKFLCTKFKKYFSHF